MANVVKYNDVNWQEGTPIAGERLATNGHYTGEFKGTPLQDAKTIEAANQPHYVEGEVVRYGTMLQDAKDTNFPTVKGE
jgi:hypothetical protein